MPDSLARSSGCQVTVGETLPAAPPVVIVGAGPAGMRAAQDILRSDPHRAVTIFGEERWQPYNRVLLTPLFAGETTVDGVYAPWRPDAGSPTVRLVNRRIVSVDRVRRRVADEYGEAHPFKTLILATGSRPHIPNIAGIDRRNVYTFRDLDDVQRLLAHVPRCRRTVVIGGGLLGLEAARGLYRRGVSTVVIEHERWLMFHQLDPAAGDLLAARIRATGVEVLTGVGVREVVAGDRIRAIRLTDGREVACDTVVVCAGIRPNVELAAGAGLPVGRGISVDDNMQTADPAIYAVGECAEHRGRIFGLVAPGLEQAGVAAHHILGGSARYEGSMAATKLKVVGVPVFSIGMVKDAEDEPWYRRAVFTQADENAYRRVLLSRGRLIGAMAVGDWPEINRLQEAVTRRRRVMPWQLRRFRRCGRLWPETDAGAVQAWPETATVCNCTGVTRGVLSSAVASGCDSIAALQAATGASTVCGSCRSLLAELVGAGEAPTPPRGARWLLWCSGLGLLVVLAVLFGTPPAYRTSVQEALPIDLLWTDKLYKQISGFTLVGLGMLAILLSARKRVRWVRFGDYASWRVLHAALGAGTLAVLLAHTGLHLGEHLNRMLMASFLAVALMGAASGGITALECRLGAGSGARARRVVTWLHILACWPLPVLLGFHIFSVYYF
jgi:nitrite reductase (NADH) large subunit